jgi:DNA-directed RNA polymerase III subunit RPC6
MDDLILSLCSDHTKLKDSELDALLSSQSQLNPDLKVHSLNSLLSKGKISITEEDGEVVYQVLSESHSSAMKRLEGSDSLILQLVRQAGEKGIWNGEIKKQTNVPVVQINKILNHLQKQGLVFSHKSVSTNKNMWFMQGTQPNNEATGGFLFAKEGFDNSLMSDLCGQIRLLLSDKSCSLKEILEYVRANVNKNIAESNLVEVMASMTALGEVSLHNTKYRANGIFPLSPLVVPCFGCALRIECRANGLVNPSECAYLDSWLDY